MSKQSDFQKLPQHAAVVTNDVGPKKCSEEVYEVQGREDYAVYIDLQKFWEHVTSTQWLLEIVLNTFGPVNDFV